MTGPVYSFSYDANGNITNDGSRSFAYGSFDKPTSINNSGVSSSMWYGVDRELYYKEDSYLEGGNNVTYKTTYLDNYEKLVRSGGNGALTEHKCSAQNSYRINAQIIYRSIHLNTAQITKLLS